MRPKHIGFLVKLDEKHVAAIVSHVIDWKIFFSINATVFWRGFRGCQAVNVIFAVTVAFLIVVKNNKNETRLVLSKFFRTFVFQEDYHPWE